MPCDILFVGSHPDETDAATSEPLQSRSPSGAVLDHIIADACPGSSYLITNAVACVPYEDTSKVYIRSPKTAEAESCSHRIIEILDICKPKFIVALGKVADKQLSYMKLDHLTLQHPLLIARQGDRGAVDLKRCILQLRDYVSQTRLW